MLYGKILIGNLGVNTMDINSMYPVMPLSEYKKLINSIYGHEKGVNNMSEPYLNRYNREDTSKDIHFLFETDNWNGTPIKEMTSSHIINTILMLLKRANEFKLKHELFVIDNMNGKLLVPKDNIEDLAKLDAKEWIKNTPVMMAFIKELDARSLLSYFEIVSSRIEISVED